VLFAPYEQVKSCLYWKEPIAPHICGNARGRLVTAFSLWKDSIKGALLTPHELVFSGKVREDGECR